MKDCRSALNAVGWQKVPAESVIDSNRGQGRAWQCNSSYVCTNHVPYHVSDLKGHAPWFSDHQSRISMHDGPRDQACTFWCQMTCNAHNQIKRLLPLSWLGQEVEHACQCYATLIIQTSMQAWTWAMHKHATIMQGIDNNHARHEASMLLSSMWDVN